MIYYSIIFLIIILQKLPHKVYCITIGLLLLLFTGLRSNSIGADTPMYQYMYQLVQEGNYQDMVDLRGTEQDAVEWGYYLIQYLFSRWFDYDFFKFFCSSMVVVPATCMIYKYTKHAWVAFLILFTLPMFPTIAMSAMRQGLAFGCIMMAAHYCFQRKIWQYLFFCAIAFSFHYSAIVFVPIYIFNFIQYKRKYNYIVVFVLFIVAYFSAQLFEFMNLYSRQQYEEGIAGGFGMLLLLLLWAFASLFITEEKIRQYDNKMFLYLLFVTIAFWFIGMNLAAVFRVAIYTEFFVVIFVAKTLYEIRNRTIRKIVILISCIASIIAMQRITLQENSESLMFYPYNFLWETLN